MSKDNQDSFEFKFYNKYKDKFKVVGNYINSVTPILIKHNKCGTEFNRKPNALISKNSNCYCPVCDGYPSSKGALKKINDIWTLRPDIANYLKNEEDGYKYTIHSGKKLLFICPNCNKEIYQTVSKVVSDGIKCKFCNDNISYPNKFMANLLFNLGVDFKTEYVIPKNTYRYDFYFIIKDTKYIVEMDGGLGHGNKTIYGENDINGKMNDLKKDQICMDNNINMIRINCNYGTNNRFEFIKNNVLNSELNELFDMSNINFKNIDIICNKSILIDICNSWNNGIISYDELGKIYFGLKRSIIRQYLKKGSELGLIKESYSQVLSKIRIASNQKIKQSKGIKIKCNQTGEIFMSISDAKKYMNSSSIHKFLKGKSDYAGKLPDGTKLTWSIIS